MPVIKNSARCDSTSCVSAEPASLNTNGNSVWR